MEETWLARRVVELLGEGFAVENFFYDQIKGVKNDFIFYGEELRPLLIGYVIKRGLGLKEHPLSSAEAEDLINACLLFNDPFTAGYIAGVVMVHEAVNKKIINKFEEIKKRT